ncbi:NUDIX domain-containing protein [Mycobacterium avium]|uniref:NUDIX domain-containing protein n=1 Tax=Mycobacterium avium TaxID=1764 RepID=UPI001CDD3619|nr:NUDIX hydrolase [Mycobacterium avium]MCA4732164.1 NUDIX hydrolase [Mycobacterium avium subsp. hominissuis]MDO2360992.1 NUDIX hydrolase [Mycobacterium avium subsp. hominissuis]UBV03755.1 NUDIX hydrolase [Mycobacterium avium subsp. hominissuis]
MSHRDGNGHVRSTSGERFWGRYGAAGLLLAVPAPEGSSEATEPGTAVLLQRRAWWTDHGGTWGIPGGAVDSHENATQAALRELREETHIWGRQVAVRATEVTKTAELAGGGVWTYTTVIATAGGRLTAVGGGESEALRWVPVSDVTELRLHPGLAASWQHLAALVANLTSGARQETI